MLLFQDLRAPRRPPRWLLPVVVPVLLALLVASNVGNIMLAHWVETRPRVLLALNTRSTVALLVSPRIDAVSYYAIGTARFLAADPFLFAIGYFYGDGALRWTERKVGRDGYSVFRWTEKLFHAARWPMVAIAPNNIICLLAGATRMAVGPFLVLNVVGSVVRLWAMRAFGGSVAPLLGSVTGFLNEWKWPISATALALVAVQWFSRRRSGGLQADLDEITGHDREHPTATETDTAPRPASAHGNPTDERPHRHKEQP